MPTNSSTLIHSVKAVHKILKYLPAGTRLIIRLRNNHSLSVLEPANILLTTPTRGTSGWGKIPHLPATRMAQIKDLPAASIGANESL